MSTFTVADEIHFQGYRVAILTTDAPATVIGLFEDHINAGTLFDADKYQCSECNAEAVIPHLHDCKQYQPPEKGGKGGETRAKVEESAYDCCLDDVQRVAKEYARGGLLKLTDLAKLCKELKESGE
jgi:hypothetical protein